MQIKMFAAFVYTLTKIFNQENRTDGTLERKTKM